MKRNLLAVAVIAIAALTQTEAKAQIVNTTRVNVVLADIMGTTNPTTTPGTGTDPVGAGNNNGTGTPGTGIGDQRATTTVVDFNYSIPQHYSIDQTVIRPGSINVISSRDFQITVKAESQTFNYTGVGTATENQKPIDVSVVRIAAKPTGTANYGTPVTLQVQPASILQNQTANSNAGYDVQYTIPATEAQKFISAKTGTHTVLVYYTITGA